MIIRPADARPAGCPGLIGVAAVAFCLSAGLPAPPTPPRQEPASQRIQPERDEEECGHHRHGLDPVRVVVEHAGHGRQNGDRGQRRQDEEHAGNPGHHDAPVVPAPVGQHRTEHAQAGHDDVGGADLPAASAVVQQERDDQLGEQRIPAAVGASTEVRLLRSGRHDEDGDRENDDDGDAQQDDAASSSGAIVLAQSPDPRQDDPHPGHGRQGPADDDRGRRMRDDRAHDRGGRCREDDEGAALAPHGDEPCGTTPGGDRPGDGGRAGRQGQPVGPHGRVGQQPDGEDWCERAGPQDQVHRSADLREDDPGQVGHADEPHEGHHEQ